MRKNEIGAILGAVSRESIAYRGYLIRFNAFRCEWWIEKDGRRISGATSVDDARRTIEMLVEN